MVGVRWFALLFSKSKEASHTHRLDSQTSIRGPYFCDVCPALQWGAEEGGWGRRKGKGDAEGGWDGGRGRGKGGEGRKNRDRVKTSAKPSV